MTALPVIAPCKRVRPLYAKMMCRSCYNMQWREQHQGICAQCGEQGVIASCDGRCNRCWQRDYWRQTARRGVCHACGRVMVIRSLGMCQTCYQKSIRRHDKCDVCGEHKTLKYRHQNICDACDVRLRRQQGKELAA